MKPEEFEIFIACLPGLEHELLSEIKKNSFKQTKLMVGGVSLFGDWRDVWRANFYLRGATKVLVRFASFRVTHLAQLDKLSHNLNWESLLQYKKSFRVFKPLTDTRNKKNKIISHSKIEIDATTVDDVNEILKYKDKCDVIGIDEAQFFSEDIISVCNDLANNNVRVIVAGLDMDFSGKPFGPMPFLMAIAEDVTKVHAKCSETGEPAVYSYRKVDNNETVMIGEKKEYKPLSRNAFISKLKRN